MWQALQPTTAEARMDPVVVAATDGSVVLEYTWRAVDRSGTRFETTTLGGYEVRNGRLTKARMFDADHAGLVRFLRRAGVGISSAAG